MTLRPTNMPKPARSYKLTLRQVDAARRTFRAHESRDLFYRVATELVDLVLRCRSSLKLAEALAVLLQTWNKAFYQYSRFDKQHFADIERVLEAHLRALAPFRKRSIETFRDNDHSTIETLFTEFELVLGPVGAAKSLHLLASNYFPLWDRAIANAYSLGLAKRGYNACRYLRFMSIAQQQCLNLRSKRRDEWHVLKAIDEYNYCKHTKGWI